jgi:hypothetical protein
MLRTAAENAMPRRQFKSRVFGGNEWDQFLELWAPRIHAFVEEALGPYQVEPLPDILPMSTGMHVAGATASFHPLTGQVTLSPSVAGKPGMILEKITHEFVHGSLAHFPEGDPFYEESVVDYMTWVMAHAPCWEPYRDAMIEAAEFNIRHRRERAFKSTNDYDRKRWAGGVFAMLAYGPLIVGRFRNKKLCGDLTW